jgi:hypothetical protein
MWSLAAKQVQTENFELKEIPSECGTVDEAGSPVFFEYTVSGGCKERQR